MAAVVGKGASDKKAAAPRGNCLWKDALIATHGRSKPINGVNTCTFCISLGPEEVLGDHRDVGSLKPSTRIRKQRRRSKKLCTVTDTRLCPARHRQILLVVIVTMACKLKGVTVLY